MLRSTLLLLALLSGTTSARAVEFSTEHILHQEKSLYRNIFVLQAGNERCMSFGRRDGRQGCIDLARHERLVLPYTRNVLAAFLAVSAPRRVLVIGLGVGVMPTAIHRYDASIQVDTVELDPAVVTVAKRYFGFRESAHSRVHVGDGRVFVRAQRRLGARYDLVLIDAFDVKYIPEHLLTREFLSEVRDILAPGGVVAANTFAAGPLQPYEMATYQAVFGTLITVEWADSGNRILLAGRDGLPSIAELRGNAARIAPRLAPSAVSATALGRMLHRQPGLRGIRPLTDQYSPANLLLGY